MYVYVSLKYGHDFECSLKIILLQKYFHHNQCIQKHIHITAIILFTTLYNFPPTDYVIRTVLILHVNILLLLFITHSFLCCVFCVFLSSFCVLCTQCYCHGLWIVHSCWPRRFSLTFCFWMLHVCYSWRIVNFVIGVVFVL